MVECEGVFDIVFFNVDGMLVEGGCSMLLVKFDGVWWMLLLFVGVLLGVMCVVLLKDVLLWLDGLL